MNGFTYEYFLKDHLGNTRVSFRAEENKAVVVQENHYYPFGMAMHGLNEVEMEAPDERANKFLYNGKELQDDFELDWYDYGARMYDPKIGRWHAIDPHAENYLNWTPYNYVANNPLFYTDPTGMDWYTSTDGSATMWKKGSGEIDGYKNIGDNYTQDIGDGVTINFTQNEATELKVITKTEWVSQYSRDDWGGTPSTMACGKASDAMLGEKTDASITAITLNAGNGRAGKANINANAAIKRMKFNLENGTGVKVGVDFREGSSGHRDEMGDHFIVIDSYSDKLNKGKIKYTEFHFMDPGTKHNSKGTSLLNLLKIKNGRLEGNHINKANTQIVVTSLREKK